MQVEKILPIILITIMVFAAVVYAGYGNWRMCIYFASAAVLNAVVVF